MTLMAQEGGLFLSASPKEEGGRLKLVGQSCFPPVTHTHTQSQQFIQEKIPGLGAGASGGDRREEEVEVWKRRQSLQADGAAAQMQETCDSAHGTAGKMKKYLFYSFTKHICVSQK